MNKQSFLAAALTLTGCLAFSAVQAQTMGAAEVKVAKDRISADYKAAKTQCGSMSGNAKDICVAEAKGKEDVAKAELAYARSGKPVDMTKVAMAKAESTYEVAKERCDDKSGNDTDVCRREAKAAEVRAKADAKSGQQSAEQRKDSAEDKRDADYKVAAEKCDAMSGDAKSACVKAAKSRFGKG